MAYDPDPASIYYDGSHYCWFDEEFWRWNPDQEVWEALAYQPEFLSIVNDRLTLVTEDGKHYCSCPTLVVVNRGCLCDGL